MSASSAGALKAWIESQGLGIAVFRDQAPANQALPYVTITEQISLVPAPVTAQFDRSGGTAMRELAQVDVWQQWRKSDNSLGEDRTLAGKVTSALIGAKLTTAPTHVWGVTVRNAIRMPVELDTNIVHHAITVQIDREVI